MKIRQAKKIFLSFMKKIPPWAGVRWERSATARAAWRRILKTPERFIHQSIVAGSSQRYVLSRSLRSRLGCINDSSLASLPKVKSLGRRYQSLLMHLAVAPDGLTDSIVSTALRVPEREALRMVLRMLYSGLVEFHPNSLTT